MVEKRTHIKAVIQALFVVFLWATSWVLIKFGLQEIPALTFAGLRYTLAFLCMLPVVLFSGRWSSLRSIPGKSWGRLVALGLLLYAFTQGAMFLALAYLPAVTTNLLWSFSNVTVALMGIVWLAERPSRIQWLGVILATLGAVIYFYPAALPREQLFGVFVAAVGVLANAGASILGRDINRSGELGPLVVTTISMGVGAAALLVTGVAVQGLPPITPTGWAIIAWLAVVNTAFAFTLWNHTLRTLTAMQSSIINGTMIIWIPLFAVLFLTEQVTAKELFGLVIVGAGTIMVQLRRP